MNQNPKVFAIVVAYHPSMNAMTSLINATAHQVSELVVVDNTPFPSDDLSKALMQHTHLHYIALNANMGIAYAHNKGIEWAHQQGADYVLLLDQDSVPADDMVKKLLVRHEGNQPLHDLTAAVGPAYQDPRTGMRSYFMVSRFGFPYRYKLQNNYSPKEIVNVSFLISSGTLISMARLLAIGGMRSNYFIDHVDTEWCFRARAKGYQLIGDHDALMHHSLGDKVKRIWLIYMRNVSYHSPLRDYYMFRNTLLLICDVKISIIWQLFLLFRLAQFAGYFLIFSSERHQRFTYMLLGIRHGLKRISGRLDTNTFQCTPIPKTVFDPVHE